MSGPFKMKGYPYPGTSPVKQAFSQKKIKTETRINPYSKKKETVNKGYDADIDDIQMAKTVLSINKDIQEQRGTRSGVTEGSAADAAGYAGKAATAKRKGIYKEKYNVGEYGSLDEGSDIAIAKEIKKTTPGFILAKPLNLFTSEKSKHLKI